jgi:hypothetical protein
VRGRHRASSWCAEALKRAALPPSERHHLLASDPALSVLTAAACRSQDEHHDNPNICRETATSTISNLGLALILPSRNIAAINLNQPQIPIAVVVWAVTGSIPTAMPTSTSPRMSVNSGMT